MTKAPSTYVRPKDIDNRSTFWQRVQWRLEAFAWDWVYWAPMKALGPERASNFGGWLVRKIGPRLSQHKTVHRNLKLAFPEWSEEKRKQVALDCWESVGRIAGELPHLSKWNPYSDEVDSDRIEIVGQKHLDTVNAAGTGAVMLSGHFANWEVMCAAITRGAPGMVVTYRALNNPHIDRRIAKARMTYGMEMSAAKGIGTRELMRALSAGKPVGLMNDQKFNEGIPVPFFGYDAMTAPGPTRLAIKYKLPIFLISTVRTGPARFRVTYHPPLEPRDTGNLEADIRATVIDITNFIEARIREHPEQWFWQHRRWPKEAWRKAGII